MIDEHHEHYEFYMNNLLIDKQKDFDKILKTFNYYKQKYQDEGNEYIILHCRKVYHSKDGNIIKEK